MTPLDEMDQPPSGLAEEGSEAIVALGPLGLADWLVWRIGQAGRTGLAPGAIQRAVWGQYGRLVAADTLRAVCDRLVQDGRIAAGAASSYRAPR